MSADPAPTQPRARPYELTLRAMRWQDIETLAGLEVELFGADAWPPQTWWAELAGRPRRAYLVAQDDQGVAGYTGLDLAGEVADLMTIAVAPRCQGCGIGALLLDAVTGQAHDSGARSLLLEVRADNAPARAMYARAGFTVVDVRRRYYQPGDVDALVMRLDLAGRS